MLCATVVAMAAAGRRKGRGVREGECWLARGCGGREDDGDESALVAERALSLSLCWCFSGIGGLGLSAHAHARVVGLDRTGVSLCRLALLLGWKWGCEVEEARLGEAEELWFWA